MMSLLKEEEIKWSRSSILGHFGTLSMNFKKKIMSVASVLFSCVRKGKSGWIIVLHWSCCSANRNLRDRRELGCVQGSSYRD